MVTNSRKVKKRHNLIIEEDIVTMDTNTDLYWETVYQEKYNGNKYKKNTKNFSKIIHGKVIENPNIYIIPRKRGGPSYKDVKLEYDNTEDIQFCPISKGYSMQDVSSFTLGPIVNHGLNLINSAFSKSIAIKHIDGSGIYTEKNKKYWKKNRKGAIRNIVNISDNKMKVDGIEVDKIEWLEENKDFWFENWKKWHDSIRLDANGLNDSINCINRNEVIIYCNCIDVPNQNVYMDFITWKKKCFIGEAYKLLNKKDNRVMNFLKLLYCEKKISIGLVYPIGKKEDKEKAITPELINYLYNSHEMTRMCYVVAGYLLGVIP
jgi:hypothetical protein